MPLCAVGDECMHVRGDRGKRIHVPKFDASVIRRTEELTLVNVVPVAAEHLALVLRILDQRLRVHEVPKTQFAVSASREDLKQDTSA